MLKTIWSLGTIIIIFSGCDFTQSALVNSENSAVQTNNNKSTNARADANVNVNQTKTDHNDDSEEGNEIKQCSPKKIFQRETLTITFRKSHGQNFAIYNEKTRYFYFLTENDRWYFPYIRYDEFKKLLSLDLEVSKVRSMSEEIDSEGENKSKPYFTKTGWYRVIIGHQALDVNFIDMPVTGSCRIYYVNKKRPPGK